MQFKLPELGEGVYEGEAVRWLVQAGESVKPGQTLLEVLTDKATMEVPAPFAGVIDKLLVNAGDRLKIGQAILEYQDKAGASPKAAAKESKPAAAKSEREIRTPPAASSSTNGPIKAAPSVRLMARKLGIDLQRVAGSGPEGRILIDDLARQMPQREAATKVEPPPQDFGKPGTRVKLVGIRRKIAEHLTQSKQTIPHYAYVDECDVTELVKLRAAVKEAFASKGTKLTYLAFFVKAVVTALKEVPIVNASLDEGAGEIVYHDRYHIGIAVAAPAGLIVPVIHDADKKSLFEIAREIERLSNDARTGKSQLEDLRGGTFTVTSIGNVGGLISTPIINHPEVGILGVGKVVRRPVFDDRGGIRPADLVYLSFSFDHRVLDGAIGAAFGNVVVRELQNPARMLL